MTQPDTYQSINSLRLPTFVLRFGTPIAQWEVPLLRGAVIKATNQKLLFHNHVGEGLRYSYPLVQYKRIGGKAAIVFVGDQGVQAATDFFRAGAFDVQLGQRQVTLALEHADAHTTTVALWDDAFSYTLRKYLPLNQQNHKLFKQTNDPTERRALIERILRASILSFAKGIGLHLDGQATVAITAMDEPRLYSYKQVKMMGFDLEFTTNMSLPDYIGLGKDASLGFGTLKRTTNQQQK